MTGQTNSKNRFIGLRTGFWLSGPAYGPEPGLDPDWRSRQRAALSMSRKIYQTVLSGCSSPFGSSEPAIRTPPSRGARRSHAPMGARHMAGRAGQTDGGGFRPARRAGRGPRGYAPVPASSARSMLFSRPSRFWALPSSREGLVEIGLGVIELPRNSLLERNRLSRRAGRLGHRSDRRNGSGRRCRPAALRVRSRGRDQLAMRANSLIIDSICATSAAFFLDVKTLQADECIPRFHHIRNSEAQVVLQSFDNQRETLHYGRIKVAASLPNQLGQRMATPR